LLRLGQQFWHAHLVEGIVKNYPMQSIGQITEDSCEISRRNGKVKVGKMNCDEFISKALNAIVVDSDVKTVIISSPFGEVLDDTKRADFVKIIESLSAVGKRVVIVGPTQ
jgi:hypothetical protein